ncbi:WYL domain-containing protein [Flavobacterium sp.]|uniref:WYL domain-containing protein n=1 Tax=Flavobacterium sp. TaxID=239 RepID=UPI0026309AB6|nr:WYL domain-containing protein [Flavobacterium sp.]MDD3004555.1 WYL domain-containing protein [Flavobacterium sp.]
MTQIQRLKEIYQLLWQKAYSKNEIIALLEPKVSLRQLERDLIDIKNSYLRPTEELLEIPNGKRMYYSITKRKTKKRKLNFDDFCIYDLLLNSENEVLNKKFDKQVLFFQNFKKALFETFGEHQNFVQKNIIYKTHFYELYQDETFIKNIIPIYKAIYDEKYIQVKQVDFDATGDNPELRSRNLKLKPLKIIFHRGDYFLFSHCKQNYKIFEIGQLMDVIILDKSFTLPNYQAVFEQEMSNRFGVSNNINQKLYDIELEFSESTGNYISKMKWHESQQIKKLPNKNYRLTMRCGINRELGGWIFQWMNNVKVIQPPELINIYQKIINSIHANNQKNNRLESINFFNKG